MDVSSGRLRPGQDDLGAEQRIAALQAAGLLDAPADERFDRLTRLARRCLGVPVALVSLLDVNRQFFLSAQGLPEPWASLRETPLSHSFCRSVVETRSPLSVSDAREDARVRGNAAVGDLGVVAYLGVPLALPDGCVVGALCAVDREPRAWTTEDEHVLADLAGAVMAEIAAGLRLRELEAAGAARRESEARYCALFEAIDSGFCIIEVKFDEEQRPIDYRFVEVNPAFAGQTDLADAVGKWMRELAPDHEQHWFDIYGRIALTGGAVRFENVAAALGRWYDVYAFRIGEPGAHQVAILFNDISDRRRAETALRESEARYRALFEVSPQMVWFADAEGRCTYVNQHYTDFVGLAPEQVMGEAWLATVHPEDRESVRAAWVRAVASGGGYEVEFRSRYISDASHRWLLVRGAPLRGPDGQVERWIGVGMDIDDRRRAELGLSALIKALGVAVYTTDSAGRLTFYNEAAVALWGWRPPLHDGRWCGSLRLRWPDGTPMRHEECPMAVALRENRPIRGEEAVAERPDGTRVPFAAYPTPLRDARGALVGGVNVLVDITKRKAAEVALAESEARLRLAMEAGHHAFWELDLATRQVLRAPFHDEIFGYESPLPAWSYGAFLDHVLPEDRAQVERAYRVAVEGGAGAALECRIRRAGDGEVRWIELHGRAQRDAGGQVVRLHGVLRDITDRKRIAGALQASEARLRLAHEVTGMGTWEWDPETGEHLWTPEQYALFGLDPARDGPLTFARAVAEVVHADDSARVEAALHGAAASGGTIESVFRAWRRRPDASREMRWIIARGCRVRRADGSPGRMLGVTMDITERQATEARLQELQAELLHVSRLSAAGEMASALAHELNQPLTAATSAIQAVRRMLASSPPEAAKGPMAEAREAVDLAAEQALWAGRIVRRLRDFVARGETEKRLEDLPRLVGEASALAMVGARERRVHVAARFDSALPPVLVDAIQIQQVLFNLIRNALEAMSAEGDGDAEAPPRRRNLVVSAGPARPDMVEVAVSDSGPGLAPEVAGRLFETFVSTKPSGMGVGLSICRSIVEAHGGRLWAEPNPGGGAVFRFTLPIAPSLEAEACQGPGWKRDDSSRVQAR